MKLLTYHEWKEIMIYEFDELYKKDFGTWQNFYHSFGVDTPKDDPESYEVYKNWYELENSPLKMALKE